jgi:anthranilate synthase/aminodeoxychorismate synthase-like glutamine amidotransferase
LILLIDNYDSFTWNLVQRLGEAAIARGEILEPGVGLLVARNDEITPDQAAALNSGDGPTGIVISPGPCTPAEAGVSAAIIARFAGVVPVLGVCLGCQVMAQMHGLPVARHAIPVHGRTSPVHHDGSGVFTNLPSPMEAARYHSLVVTGQIPAPKPGHDGWALTAWTDEPTPGSGTRRVLMGLRRIWADGARAPLEGVQFHPESYLTPHGPALLENWLAMVSQRQASPTTAPIKRVGEQTGFPEVYSQR